MTILSDLGTGFIVAFEPFNLLLILLGAFIGTLVGILPGLGVSATMAILLPATFGMDPASAMILLLGVYCGARYGGATTAILMNLPGESSAVVTALDGHQMAKQGRAGAALGIAAFSSFISGTLSVVGLMLFAPLLTQVALGFRPSEFFALSVLGISLVIGLTGRSLVKGLIAAFLGALISLIGSDPVSGTGRLTFGQMNLMDGVNFVTAAVGLFAISELMLNLEDKTEENLIPVPRGLRNLLPKISDLISCIWAWIVSFVVGFVCGVIPGAGATAASFLSYGIVKGLSKNPEKFGTGIPAGVAAAESADNASTGGALVPLFTLGIPGSAAGAMLLAVLVMGGVAPGPFFIQNHSTIFWGVIAALFIGNVMLLIINLPMIPLLMQLMRLPYPVIASFIAVACCVGVYSVDNSMFDVWVALTFGVLGYFMRKFGYPPAAMLLAMILTPIAESTLRQAIAISRGDVIAAFAGRPISLAFLGAAALILAGSLYSKAKRRSTDDKDSDSATT